MCHDFMSQEIKKKKSSQTIVYQYRTVVHELDQPVQAELKDKLR